MFPGPKEHAVTVFRCGKCREVLHRNERNAKNEDAIVAVEYPPMNVFWVLCSEKCYQDMAKKVFANPLVSNFDIKVAVGRAYPMYMKAEMGRRLFRAGGSGAQGVIGG